MTAVHDVATNGQTKNLSYRENELLKKLVAKISSIVNPVNKLVY